MTSKTCRGTRVFCSAATRNKICYQTKKSRLVFKLFPGKFFALLKYSPVTLHYSLATAILNETPGFKKSHLGHVTMQL